MKRQFFSLLLFIFILSVANAQTGLLFEENFNYPDGDKLTDHGWTAHSGTGSNPITVTSPGLTYTNYHSVSGNAALLDNDGEDVSKNFTEQTSGTIYVSFLINVSNVPTGGYFIHLGPTSLGTNHNGRVWVKEESGDIEFAVTKKSNSPSYTNNDYSKNTTYLLVLKYEIIDGAKNDKVSLFVFSDPDLPGTEPATPTLGPIDENDQSDPSNLGTIALRQFDSKQNIKVDGIRIGSTWQDAPIPVELTSFTATLQQGQVILKWTTQSETENFGFHVYRSFYEDRDYAKITSSIIPGAGTSESVHHYTYVDTTAEMNRAYYYKLAAIDLNGNVNYYGPIQIIITGLFTKPDIGTEKIFSLEQNFPNPFNPDTAIEFELKETSRVILKIYNLQGQLIRTLVDEIKPSGKFSYTWNGTDESANKVASGSYIYELQVNGSVSIKKMIYQK